MSNAQPRWRVLGPTLALCLLACDARKPPPVPEEAVAAEGPETWQVDRKTYAIAGTYYEQRPDEGGWVFTVQYECGTCEDLPGRLNPEAARKAAEPLFRYAFEQGRHVRSKLRARDGTEQPVAAIAVVLYEPGWFRRSTNRISRKVTELTVTTPPG